MDASIYVPSVVGTRPRTNLAETQYGNELTASRALDDASAADRFLTRVIGEQEGDELQWASRAIEDHPDLMRYGDPATLDHVRERMKATLANPRDGSFAPYLTTLANALGVAVPSQDVQEPD
jgi:hypothetical protein